MNLDFYIHGVKRAILANYFNSYYHNTPPDQFVDTLNRIFTIKQKVLTNIAIYVQREVEVRHKPLEQTLQNISFFASIIVEYIDRGGNQPIKK